MLLACWRVVAGNLPALLCGGWLAGWLALCTRAEAVLVAVRIEPLLVLNNEELEVRLLLTLLLLITRPQVSSSGLAINPTKLTALHKAVSKPSRAELNLIKLHFRGLANSCFRFKVLTRVYHT